MRIFEKQKKIELQNLRSELVTTHDAKIEQLKEEADLKFRTMRDAKNKEKVDIAELTHKLARGKEKMELLNRRLRESAEEALRLHGDADERARQLAKLRADLDQSEFDLALSRDRSPTEKIVEKEVILQKEPDIDIDALREQIRQELLLSMEQTMEVEELHKKLKIASRNLDLTRQRLEEEQLAADELERGLFLKQAEVGALRRQLDVEITTHLCAQREFVALAKSLKLMEVKCRAKDATIRRAHVKDPQLAENYEGQLILNEQMQRKMGAMTKRIRMVHKLAGRLKGANLRKFFKKLTAPAKDGGLVSSKTALDDHALSGLSSSGGRLGPLGLPTDIDEMTIDSDVDNVELQAFPPQPPNVNLNKAASSSTAKNCNPGAAGRGVFPASPASPKSKQQQTHSIASPSSARARHDQDDLNVIFSRNLSQLHGRELVDASTRYVEMQHRREAVEDDLGISGASSSSSSAERSVEEHASSTLNHHDDRPESLSPERTSLSPERTTSSAVDGLDLDAPHGQHAVDRNREDHEDHATATTTSSKDTTTTTNSNHATKTNAKVAIDSTKIMMNRAPANKAGPPRTTSSTSKKSMGRSASSPFDLELDGCSPTTSTGEIFVPSGSPLASSKLLGGGR
ncbi:unnamed protein product [Amoebophrya sp. A25]|nr:unnamed protein product [Amoebophrya sp. A25]|eukprot:GSA25T00017394001.1